METQTDLEQLKNACDVCALPIENLDKVLTADNQGRAMKFCCEKCYKQYLEDPSLFVEFEDDEVVG
jgi:YHS domain-containing protein